MFNTACFSNCSTLSCYNLPPFLVISATDRHWNSSRAHMLQLPICDLQLFEPLFACQPPICRVVFFFFWNVEVNHSSFPGGEIVSFLSRCTKYKFQPFLRLAVEASAAFISSFAPVTANAWAFSISGEYMVWTQMSSQLRMIMPENSMIHIQ